MAIFSRHIHSYFGVQTMPMRKSNILACAIKSGDGGMHPTNVLHILILDVHSHYRIVLANYPQDLAYLRVYFLYMVACNIDLYWRSQMKILNPYWTGRTYMSFPGKGLEGHMSHYCAIMVASLWLHSLVMILVVH